MAVADRPSGAKEVESSSARPTFYPALRVIRNKVLEPY